MNREKKYLCKLQNLFKKNLKKCHKHYIHFETIWDSIRQEKGN